ncbi:hypothetical protein VF21_04663 [Pseudogymnoascus sp. 05NY08]|nr:hypothetical protein VF21_04663 [Pseudogymnoascus sp. 05NY08]
MGSSTPAQLPAMATSPKHIFFTDFDGTITSRDSNDYMTDNLGFGQPTRLGLNRQVLANEITFRSAFKQMLDSVPTPFDQCTNILLERIELDPGFRAFYDWAKANNVPIVILSGGMTPIIRALLDKLLDEDSSWMQIVSNDVGARPGKSINEEKGWEIVFHDETGFGHDKSSTIRPYAALPADQRPTMFYAGDGVSDLSAAKETDLLFAKKGHDLVTYCVKQHVPFYEFEDWTTILTQVQSIVSGAKSVKQVSAEGVEAFTAALKA